MSRGISVVGVSPLITFQRLTNTIITATTPTATIAAITKKTTIAIVVVVVLMSIVVVVVVAVVAVFIADVMVFVVVVAVAIVEVVAVFMVEVTAFVVVVVVAVAVQTVDDIDPGEPVNMLPCVALEFNQETPQSVWSKDVAPWNILSMSVTADTSHADRF